MKSTTQSDPARSPLITRRRALSSIALTSLAAAVAPNLSAAEVTDAPPRRVALVTGSSRGIGAAIARRLATDGYDVVVNYVQNRDLAGQVARAIETAGGRAIAVGADVSKPGDVKRLFDETEAAFGGVDVVINNAGVMRLAPFASMSDEDFDHVINVNLKGGFYVLREAARRVRDGGRIVSLSSSITKLRTATYGPYAASKGALELYSSCLAKELRGRQISVNAIAPGVVATPLFLNVAGRTPEDVAQFAQRTPHGRIGQPEDIAAAVSALVSADGSWINGETVFANGGLV